MNSVEEKPAIWLAEGDEKRASVQAMFAGIAGRYDLLNSLMCLNLHKRWRRIAARKLELREGESALDVCCGTGYFLPILRSHVGPTGSVVGVDFCAPMLDIAARKNGSENPVSLGDACDLPYQAGQFEAVTVGWGIRNVPNIDRAHAEIFRVLKPHGKFVSIDMAIPKNAFIRSASRFVSLKILPLLGKIFGKSEAYTYLPESAIRFWDRERLAQSMREAGFQRVMHQDLFFGNIAIHWGEKP